MRNSNILNRLKPINQNNTAYVRAIHTVPGAPNVDVYANDTRIVRNLAYGQYTNYLEVPSGSFRITLYAVGTMTNPLVSYMLTVTDDTYTTVAAVGTLDTLDLLAIRDATVPLQANSAMVRFLHLSPNAPAVDITLPNGTVLFSNVSFKEATNYLAVAPSDYTLQVRAAGTDTVVLTVPNIRLMEGYYTIYAIGLVGETPPLQALLVMDGPSA